MLKRFREDDPNADHHASEESVLQNNNTQILIIEDDHELADYLMENLQKKYRIRIAYNGVKGLKIARADMPETDNF